MDPNAIQTPPLQSEMLPQITQSNTPLFKRKLFIVVVIVVVFALLIVSGLVLVSIRATSKNTTPTPTPAAVVKPTLPPFPEEGLYVEDELVIRYTLGKRPEELDPRRRAEVKELLEGAGVISESPVYSQTTDPALSSFYKLTFKKGVNIKIASEKIYEIPEIQGVEPNVKAILNQ